MNYAMSAEGSATRKKRYLVTGTCGFAAPHLINLLLEKGHGVFALIRRTNGMETDILDVVSKENFEKINFVVGDLEDRDSLLRIFEKQQFDGCFHLAAMSLPPQSFLDPIGTFRTNIMGTANLVDVIEKTQGLNCKIHFCSTSEIYGDSGKEGIKIKETDGPLPNNPYGASKLCSEILIAERIDNKKITGFITRAYSHTGPRRGKNFSISSDAYQIAGFLNDAINKGWYEQGGGKKDHGVYRLKVGNLETVRCVMDVRDCVAGYVMLMENEGSNGNVYNICHPEPRKMSYFTDMLIRMSQLNVEKIVSPELYRPIDIQFQQGDTTALQNLTGWAPKIPIEQTLSELLNYWIKKLT